MQGQISLHEIVVAVKGGQKGMARDLLRRRLEEVPQDVHSLLMLAALAETGAEARFCLERVIEIEPYNTQAISSLALIRLLEALHPPKPARQPPVAPKAAPAGQTAPVAPAAPAVQRFRCAVCRQMSELNPAGVCTTCGCVNRISSLGNGRTANVKEEVVATELTRLTSEVEFRQNHFALRNLCIALLNLGRSTEALPYLRHWLSLDSANAEARAILERVAQSKLAMVVDDSATIRRVVSAMLEQAGFRVLAAADGDQALQWLDAGHRPEVFLLDYEMPGLNGFQVCREIRRRAHLKQTPIIMISGNLLDRMKGKLAGADEFVSKPFSAPVLLDMIRRRIAGNTPKPSPKLATSVA